MYWDGHNTLYRRREVRREANIEEWKRLYEAAEKIKEIKPWEYLWDMDLICL